MRTASISNGGSTRLGLGGRPGRASRRSAEGGTPKTFLMRRRPGDVATGRMLAESLSVGVCGLYGQEAPPAGVAATVPSPLAQILNRPSASLEYL